jgi:hypothetical protein
MTINKMLLSLCACLLFNVCHAQQKFLKTADEARALSKKSVELFQQSKVGESFDAIKTYWPLPDNEIDMLSGKTLSSMNLIGTRFGKIDNFVKVKEETITDTAIRETYLLKYEFHALRFVYTYYKSSKGWILNGFSWDDKYTEEFK